MSTDPTTDEPQPPSLRVEVVAGGDPGDAVLAAVAAILTRPVVIATATSETDDRDEPTPSRWTRAARLEGVVPGRRISTVADLAWRRPA